MKARGICPRCESNILDDGRNALSRKDNETAICDPCGTEEAMLDWSPQLGIASLEVAQKERNLERYIANKQKQI